jgi:MFS family permease
LVALILVLVLVTDPLLIFERGLVSMEKSLDFAHHGFFLASKLLDGTSVSEKLKKENLAAFCSGLVLFSLATSILFTPMPIFVSNLTKEESIVFAIFVLNSGGAVFGYYVAGRRSNQQTGKANIGRIVIFRCFLSFLLIAALQPVTYNVVLVTSILILMGFVYAIFLVHMLSLSMELIPAGKAGLFNALIGIGGACGSFIGPFLGQTFGFLHVFITAGVIFLSAYIAFRIFA